MNAKVNDNKKPKVVTLSGSMRFYDEFMRIGAMLTDQGYIVLTPFKDINTDAVPSSEYENRKNHLMFMHRRRIDMSDILFVINKGGYIGESTAEEIKYAESIKHIDIVYLEPITKRPVVTLIGSKRFMNTFKSVEHHLSQRGFVVMTPAIFKHPSFGKNNIALTDSQHQIYDELHQQKMLMSDYVVLISEEGYIGENTQEEIDFCKLRGIKVKDYEEVLLYEH